MLRDFNTPSVRIQTPRIYARLSLTTNSKNPSPNWLVPESDWLPCREPAPDCSNTRLKSNGSKTDFSKQKQLPRKLTLLPENPNSRETVQDPTDSTWCRLLGFWCLILPQVHLRAVCYDFYFCANLAAAHCSVKPRPWSVLRHVQWNALSACKIR